MRAKDNAANLIRRTQLGRQVLEDRRYRIVLFAACSLCGNLLYALYHGVLGILNRSVWFVAMCAYYTILSVMRFCAVLCGRKSAAAAPASTEYFVMRLTGALLALLSLVLSSVIYISLAQNIATRHDEILMITIATCTFYKITMAIIRAVRQRRDPSPLLAAIRSIGYAEVAASVLTLQRSMLVSFGEMPAKTARLFNIATGAAVCAFVLFLGVRMMVKSAKRKE